MPIYEYRCGTCDRYFEELVDMSNADSIRCPKCDSKRVERLLSVFSPHGADASPVPPSGGCGRCGDPNGPCQA